MNAENNDIGYNQEDYLRIEREYENPNVDYCIILSDNDDSIICLDEEIEEENHNLSSKPNESELLSSPTNHLIKLVDNLKTTENDNHVLIDTPLHTHQKRKKIEEHKDESEIATTTSRLDQAEKSSKSLVEQSDNKIIKKDNSSLLISSSDSLNNKKRKRFASASSHPPNNPNNTRFNIYNPSKIAKQNPLIKDGAFADNRASNDTRIQDIQNFDYNKKYYEFLDKILKWKFDWIEEKGKKPPIIADTDLLPLIDKYQSYEDYYKHMLPQLLIHTWDEISNSCLQNKNSKNKDFSMSVWLTAIQKSSSDGIVDLVCQTIVDRNENSAPKEEDLLKVEIEVTLLKKETSEHLGLVNQLKSLNIENSKDIYPLLKTKYSHIVNQNYANNEKKKSNVHLFQFHIFMRKLNYTTELGSELKLTKAGNLSSITRQLRALCRLRELDYKMSILNPQSADSIFSLSFQQQFLSDPSLIFNSKEPRFVFIHGSSPSKMPLKLAELIGSLFKNQKKHFNDFKLKVLICSPTDTVCDELTRRLKHEIEKNQIKIDDKEFGLVRIGRMEDIHENCLPIAYDNLLMKKSLIDNRLLHRSNSLLNHFQNLENKEKFFKEEKKKAEQNSNLTLIHENEIKLKEVQNKKKELDLRLLPNNRTEKKEEKLLLEASIIVTTTNFSGYHILNCLRPNSSNGKKPRINLIIINEASKCLETDFLISLRFGCNKFILIGDSELSMSKKKQENQFIFERLYQCFKFEQIDPVKMLSIID